MVNEYNYKGKSLEELASLPKEEFVKLPPRVLLKVTDYLFSKSINALDNANSKLEASNEIMRNFTEGLKERSLYSLLYRYSKKDNKYKN